MWCQEIKRLMIESFDQLIPDHVKELVLGTKSPEGRGRERAPPTSRTNNPAVSPTSSEFHFSSYSVVFWQCDNDNRSWYKRCNDIVSYELLWIHRAYLVEFSLLHAV